MEKQRLSGIALRAGFVAACWAVLLLLGDGETTTTAKVATGAEVDRAFVLGTGEAVGELAFEIIEAATHLPLPARLYFAYRDGREGKPTVGRFENFLVSASGFEVRTLPVGAYDVYVSRGIEYSLAQEQIEIQEGKTTQLRVELERVIDTSGFISADFHLHLQFAMQDGAIVSAAEGLELLTATDHNVLKDYAPFIQELGLSRYLHSVVGSEIDTQFGHFNSFPLQLDRWRSREYRHAIRTPGEFLRTVRQEPGEQVVQINHPRGMKSGPIGSYFDERLNAETGDFDYPFFETGFDSFEIFNAGADHKGDHIGRTQPVEQKLQDWYRLLNRGILITGVANTDAHGYPKALPAYPRNYVLSASDNPWEIDPTEVVTAVKRHAITSSGGPFIRFTGNGAPVGSLVTDRDQSVSLAIEVQSPNWIPLERVEVISNGQLIRSYSVEPPTEDGAVWQFNEELVVQPKTDSWYLVLATSEKRWSQPFGQFSSFSFTNPIFVDVDGNRYFDPPEGGYPLQPSDH